MVSNEEGIISATSPDGRLFTLDSSAPGVDGGMPGAVLLADDRVRLFLVGQGIASYVSEDGLRFVRESGVRIAPVAHSIVDNPEPIRLSDGSYLMLFSIHDTKYEGTGDPWEFTEIRLATSADGFDWAVDPRVIGLGGTSCVVEAADGTLFIYYVNR